MRKTTEQINTTHKVKKKPNWKFWVLLSIILTLSVLVVGTFFFFDVLSWVTVIVIPTILSLATGAGISLYFTIKTDGERLEDELQREIVEVLERTMYLPRILMEVAQNPFQSVVLKKQILTQEVMQTPSMFRLRETYNELWILYKDKRDKMMSQIKKWSEQDEFNEFLNVFQTKYAPELMMHIIEITDCALRVQEQYYQDFKGEAKQPISEQLIFTVKSGQEQKPN